MTPRDAAIARDAADPLAHCRAAFDLPADIIYLDGNSLGPLTHATRRALAHTVDHEWGRSLIGAWNDADWISLPARVGARIAPLIGAAPDDVICCDSTSVNLYKVLSAALALRPSRSRIVAERDNFPTDLYIADAAAERAPGVARRVERWSNETPITHALDNDVAVLLLTHVDYRSGAMHDLAEVTAAAHAAGALVVWDLAHSAGAVPVDLTAAGADFAVGCGYKYLNGGPGAPAFLYVHPRHRASARQPLTGWFGHAAPFAFEPEFRAEPDIRAFLTGTPGVLGMRALEAALSVFDDVGMADIRDKSQALGALFAETVARTTTDDRLRLASPAEPAARGSQISYRHPQAWAVMQALIADGVIGDMRAPDILRFGFAPLYTRYTDVVIAAERLTGVLADGDYRDIGPQPRSAVT